MEVIRLAYGFFSLLCSQANHLVCDASMCYANLLCKRQETAHQQSHGNGTIAVKNVEINILIF